MKNSKSVSIYLTKFKEPTEIIMKNTSRSLITTQVRWIAFLKSLRVHLLEFSKDSQSKSKREFRRYLKKKLKMLKRN
jgi:hypothetical protein